MRALVLLGLVIAIVLAANATRAGSLEQSRWLMGTELRIRIESPDHDEAAIEALLRRCFASVDRWERILSRWDPQAELAQLNASAGSTVSVSPELFGWLQRNQRDTQRTDGAFDATVGTWILYPQRHIDIGMHKVQLPARHQVLLPADLALDSGGDGKGVAVDAVVELLREAGITTALIDFGGSSYYGLGSDPQADPQVPGWRLAVLTASGDWGGIVTLHDAALSVSHSVQVDELGDGKVETRFHIFDPKSGSLVEDERTSIVVSPSATAAEVLSTALIVRGTAGLTFVSRFEASEAVLLPGPASDCAWWEPAEGP